MASVFLGDLNDYIQPSQACVNPLFSPETPTSAKITLSIEDDLQPNLSVKPNLIRAKNQKATITLDDCLACSGCVTSAEAVLITQQSIHPILEALGSETYKKKVLTLSPAARASLSNHFQLPLAVTHSKLVALFHQIGFDAVLDASYGQELMLIESRNEFVERYRSQTALPMLASSCPGWICYAEKTQPTAIPFIDTTKPPQQIMGTLLKRYLYKGEIEPHEILHVTVMPCFDKKLEASRKEFMTENVKDVDFVIATLEILQLLEELNIDFHAVAPISLTTEEARLSGVSEHGDIVYGNSALGASGGQLEHIFRYAAKELFQIQVTGPLDYISGRNPDFRHVELVVNDKVVLTFAIAYGFRNIQTVMTQLKRNKCKYHYIEIMACPSGCLNGGGQVKSTSTLQAQHTLTQVNKRFQELQERPIQHFSRELYQSYFAAPCSETAKKALHTTYNAVKPENALGITW